MILLKKQFLSSLFLVLLLSPYNKPEAKPDPADTLPLSELRAFAEAYYQIKTNYAKPTDDAKLLNAAIKGMVASLDQHSRYMDKDEFEQFNAENEGEYAGIGLSLNDHQYGLEITQVVKNSPAARAGLSEKMLITHINNQSVQFLPVNDSFELLKGKTGEKIQLTVSAASFAKPRIFELVRETILLESVSSERLPKDTGYLSISQFTLNTYDEFIHAVQVMSSKEPLTNLIIDLRNNPGGVLQVALELSDLFINSGKLLVSVGKAADANQTFYANDDALLGNLKVIILINKGSASSAEIFAAALRDHNMAMIIGEKSYGKGSIQTVIPLNNNAGIKLTSAEYFSPNGHKIQDVGLTPDIFFEVEVGNEAKINSTNIGLFDDPQVLQAYNLLLKQL